VAAGRRPPTAGQTPNKPGNRSRRSGKIRVEQDHSQLDTSEDEA